MQYMCFLESQVMCAAQHYHQYKSAILLLLCQSSTKDEQVRHTMMMIEGVVI